MSKYSKLVQEAQQTRALEEKMHDTHASVSQQPTLREMSQRAVSAANVNRTQRHRLQRRSSSLSPIDSQSTQKQTSKECLELHKQSQESDSNTDKINNDVVESVPTIASTTLEAEAINDVNKGNGRVQCERANSKNDVSTRVNSISNNDEDEDYEDEAFCHVVLDDMISGENSEGANNLVHGSDIAFGVNRSTTTPNSSVINDNTNNNSSALHCSGRHVYCCDICQQLCSSQSALRSHALEHHAEYVADYAALSSVANKLKPIWHKVCEAKQTRIREWGSKVFRIASQRDAGAAKMSEAHRARRQLEIILRQWHPNARVYIFGSSVAFGVWDGISDIDFTVVDVAAQERNAWPPMERNAVRSISELLRRAGFAYANIQPIAHARVPIIKHHASTPIALTSHALELLRAHQKWQQQHTSSNSSSMNTEDHKLNTSEDAEMKGNEEQNETHQHSVNNNNNNNNNNNSENTTSCRRNDAWHSMEESLLSHLEAEKVIARSVRYILNGSATREDRLLLEGSIRDAVGCEHVQQLWWSRRDDMLCVTFDSTTNAIVASSCALSFATPWMRAKVQPLHDECRPELHGIDFDLSFRVFGIRNSLLLRRYLLSHPCARPGAVVLKDWSKTSGVNNSVNGFLTSYAINILWIYYLVQKGYVPYVDPLDDIPGSLHDNDEVDPEYCPMIDEGWSTKEKMALCTKAGELLLGFFYFYANEFDWENHVVSLNRKGITTKQMLGWDAEEIDALHNNNFMSRAPVLPGSATWQNRPSISENDHEHDHEDNHHDGNELEMNLTGENNSNEHDVQDEQIRNTNNNSNNNSNNKRISNFGSGIGNSINNNNKNNNNNNNISQLRVNDLLIGSNAGVPRRHNTVRYSFCIEDPYEENLNLGRHMGINKSLRVQGEFCRGLLSLLKDDLHSSCVFASSDANERDRAAHTMRSSSSLDHTESSPALDELHKEKKENDKSNSDNAEVTHTMNEAAAALLTSGSVTASSSTITAVSLDNTPLPLKVVWKLMAVCTSEMVKARRLATCPSSNNKPTNDSDGNKDTQTNGFTTTTSIGASDNNESKLPMSSESDKTLQENEKVYKEDAGNTHESNTVNTSHNRVGSINTNEVIPACSDPDAISSVALEMAFMKYAPLEYKLARRVWNWQQLIHRLGYKLQNHMVRRRREVGCKRAPFPPRGIMPSSEMLSSSSSSSVASSSSASSSSVSSNQISEQYLHKLRSRGLSEEMVATMSEGYLRLTPEWVAWSRPWASLHLRGNAFFTSASLSSAAPHLTASVNNTVPGNSTSTDKETSVPDNISTIGNGSNKKDHDKTQMNTKDISKTTTVLPSARASCTAASGILSNTSKCASPWMPRRILTQNFTAKAMLKRLVHK